jgi:hypothetical protein
MPSPFFGAAPRITPTMATHRGLSGVPSRGASVGSVDGALPMDLEILAPIAEELPPLQPWTGAASPPFGGPSRPGSSWHLTDLEVEDLSYHNSQLSSFDVRHSHSGLGVAVPGVLYIGAYKDICDERDASVVGLRAFLCVAGDLASPLPPYVLHEELASGSVAFKHLKLIDGPPERLADHIDEAFAFIDEQNALGRPVAIFCQQGKSRSVSIAVAYMMREYGVSVDTAIARLRHRYKRAEPNLHFLLELSSLQPRLMDAHAALPRRAFAHAQFGSSATAFPQPASVSNATPSFVR